MFCSECGKEISEKAVICPFCGCATANMIKETPKSTFWTSATKFYNENRRLISAVLLLISVLMMICGIVDLVQSASSNSSGAWRGDAAASRVYSPSPIDVPLIIGGLFIFIFSLKSFIKK